MAIEVAEGGPQVQILSAQVVTSTGAVAATVDRIPVGGGSQTVTVDGTPEERIHPTSTTYHVRLASLDRMLPDELRDAGSWDEAVDLGVRYAVRLETNAVKLAELAADLKV